MSKNTVRLLTVDEIGLMKSMFEHNPYANGFKLTEEEIDKFCESTIEDIAGGIRQVAISIDSKGDPIAMSVGIERPAIAGWIQGLTMVRYPRFYLEAQPMRKFFSSTVVAETVDFLVTYMESKRYFKFWDMSIDTIANTGRYLVTMQSQTLHRYNYYDELIIPPGEQAGVHLFDRFRRVHPTEPVIVRMFSLRQEHRLKLI